MTAQPLNCLATSQVEYLYDHMAPNQIEIPDFVKATDQKVRDRVFVGRLQTHTGDGGDTITYPCPLQLCPALIRM